MEKIIKLTAEHKRKVVEYHDRFFHMATSTRPGDWRRSEKAALRLAEIGGLKNCKVTIVENPKEGFLLQKSLWAPLEDTLKMSIEYDLLGSIDASLGYTLGSSGEEILWALLKLPLYNSLVDSIEGSIKNLLSISLGSSLWNSFWCSSWIAHYLFAVEELGIECSDKHREMLDIYCEITEHTSAIWIIPGTIIICKKPNLVKIKEFKMVSVEWKEETTDIKKRIESKWILTHQYKK